MRQRRSTECIFPLGQLDGLKGNGMQLGCAGSSNVVFHAEKHSVGIINESINY